jgi:hypothetical protein
LSQQAFASGTDNALDKVVASRDSCAGNSNCKVARAALMCSAVRPRRAASCRTAVIPLFARWRLIIKLEYLILNHENRGDSSFFHYRPKSSMHGVSHVPEFVGITHDIDGDDPG